MSCYTVLHGCYYIWPEICEPCLGIVLLSWYWVGAMNYAIWRCLAIDLMDVARDYGISRYMDYGILMGLYYLLTTRLTG